MKPTHLSGSRVLAVHPYPDLFGADLMLLSALQVLGEWGAYVEVVVPEEGPLLDRLSAADIPYRISPFPVLRKALLSPNGVRSLVTSLHADTQAVARLGRSARPDVIYVNTLTLPHWLLARTLHRKPVVCHVHEAEEGLPLPLSVGLVTPLSLATRVIANSDATRRFLVRHAPWLRRSTSVIYNGFPMPEMPLRRPGMSSPIRLLLVGRLNPRKGQDLAIEALAKLRATGLDVFLDIVGSPFRGYEWYESKLGLLAGHLGVEDYVRFRGYCSPIWPTYEEACVVLVPSRIEPFGNVAVEAMSVGRPVIAASVGGLPEIVRHGQTGMLCRPGDSASLAAAVEALLRDPRAVEQLGCNAARDVRSRFSLDRFADKLTARFNDALQAAS